ncbi:FtsL-like putative cell division protein [Flavobacterium sp. JP2137]|uniref:FtsL-like putative cell division protein n=1 Tax=Flavobacterium sp. JP2137 TaxID=3414510 RepID=UPI003D300C08
MKLSVYNIIRAKYLIDENSMKNWLFIIYLIVLSLLMIANIHYYESKNFRIAELNHEVKELRSEFVDTRSELMELKMESTVSRKMEEKGIFPSMVPPQKIKVVQEEKKGIFKIWQ